MLAYKKRVVGLIRAYCIFFGTLGLSLVIASCILYRYTSTNAKQSREIDLKITGITKKLSDLNSMVDKFKDVSEFYASLSSKKKEIGVVDRRYIIEYITNKARESSLFHVNVESVNEIDLKASDLLFTPSVLGVKAYDIKVKFDGILERNIYSFMDLLQIEFGKVVVTDFFISRSISINKQILRRIADPESDFPSLVQGTLNFKWYILTRDVPLADQQLDQKKKL